MIAPKSRKTLEEGYFHLWNWTLLGYGLSSFTFLRFSPLLLIKKKKKTHNSKTESVFSALSLRIETTVLLTIFLQLMVSFMDILKIDKYLCVQCFISITAWALKKVEALIVLYYNTHTHTQKMTGYLIPDLSWSVHCISSSF